VRATLNMSFCANANHPVIAHIFVVAILLICDVVEVFPGATVLDHSDLECWICYGEEVCWDDEPVVGTETNRMDE
jgi:hypothetical protein